MSNFQLFPELSRNWHWIIASLGPNFLYDNMVSPNGMKNMSVVDNTIKSVWKLGIQKYECGGSGKYFYTSYSEMTFHVVSLVFHLWIYM